MSALWVGIIALSAVGLYYSARLEGYVDGLRYHDQQRRQEVERHREWLLDHLPQQEGLGRRWCEGNGTGQRDSL